MDYKNTLKLIVLDSWFLFSGTALYQTVTKKQMPNIIYFGMFGVSVCTQ